MRWKKAGCAVLAAFLAAGLCGCDFLSADTDRLLAAPQLTGELKPIGAALAGSIGGDYTLRYPSGGDRRSAVILSDIDGDGAQEAFAFYSRGEEEMHLNVIRQNGGKWRSSDDYSITAGGVERIDFYDIDADGVQEVLVGWEIHGSNEKQLAVFDASGEKLSQMMLQRYTAYTCCDLDADGIGEIFLQLLSTTDSVNRAYLYRFEAGGFSEVSSCAMDRNVKSVVSQITAPLSSGQNAVYVDELKSAGAVTEVLFLSKGQLVNPLLDATNSENLRTERAASLMCADVNRDELLEIPVAEEIPAVSGSTEKCYYTKWSTFNGETLLTRRTDLINQTDGFYLIIPEKWVGYISVYRDSEKRLREFYASGNPQEPSPLLVRLRAVDADLWDAGDLSASGLTELCRSGDTVLAGSVSEDGGALAVTLDELKKRILILE